VLSAQFLPRLPLFHRHQQGQIVGGAKDEIVPAFEQDGALGRSSTAPGSESACRGVDGAVRFDATAIRYATEPLTGRGVVDVDRGAPVREGPVLDNKASLGEHGSVGAR
jgi:hypothetical protein